MEQINKELKRQSTAKKAEMMKLGRMNFDSSELPSEPVTVLAAPTMT